MDPTLLEAFALADDRAAIVARLITGTEEHAFLKCLLHQQRGEIEAARQALDAPPRRHTAPWEQLRLHQQLLEASPGRPEGLLGLRSGENLEHRCERPGQTPPLPATIAQGPLTPTAIKHAKSRREQVDALTDEGLLGLLDDPDLAAPVRARALERLAWPRHPRLLDHLVADLGDQPARRFGALAIHRQLTLEQLDELARRVPALGLVAPFVERSLELLAVDEWGRPRDEDERIGRQLARLDALPASFRPRRVERLRERLRLRWRRGQVDLDTLARYVEATASEARPPNARERDWVEPAPAADDTLDRVLAAGLAAGDERFEGHFAPAFLRQRRAEARLLAGDDPALWTSHLSAPQLLELQKRVELAFAPDNPAQLGPADPVTLRLDVKNVEALTIRVFQIDPVSYFRARGAEVGTDVDLDGFVPNHERRLPLDRPGLVRHRVAVELPEAQAPGTYVVDLVGGGLSCRAVLRKGQLRAVERSGAAGTVLTVLDESGRVVPGATVWLGERAFEADARGEATLPFSGSAGLRPALLQRGAVASLQQVTLHAERYELSAAFHAEREDLLPGAEVRLLVRARLTAAGAPADPSLLEKLRLVVAATRGDVTTERSYPELRLASDGELLLSFTCPDNLDTLALSLTGEVAGLDGQRHAVSAAGVLSPGASPAGRIAGLHLVDEPAGWSVLVLGRAGEPVVHAPVSLALTTRASSQALAVSLATDREGRVALGPLADVVRLEVGLDGQPGGHQSRAWSLERRAVVYPAVLHLGRGEALRLPRPADTLAADAAAALFVCRGPLLGAVSAEVVRDVSDRLTVDDEQVSADGLPPGDYVLHLPGASARIVVRVAGGPRSGGWLLDGSRRLGPAPAAPPRLRVRVEDATLRIEVAGASRRARVHLFASTLAHPLPALALARDDLAGGLVNEAPLENDYTSARTLGDEARYILARRHAPRPAGNLLPRPGLLLNPWAVGEARPQAEKLRHGDSFKPKDRRGGSGHGGGGGASRESDSFTGHGGPPRLDFLPRSALVLANQGLDERGVLELPLAALAGRGVVQVLLVDSESGASVARQVAVAPLALRPRELRFRSPLDREVHHQQRGEATALVAGQSLVLEGTFRLYDSLESAWTLLEALDPARSCARLDFLRTWHLLDDDQKRRHFSESACHELCFFLARKDPAFFEGVIRPYLVHKHHLTFLDEYLLGHDLTAWSSPSRRASLNALERVLLATRLGDLADEHRALADQLAASPANPDLVDRLFRAALQSDALDAKPSDELTRTFDETMSAQTDSPPPPPSRGAFGSAAAPGLPSPGGPAVAGRRAAPAPAAKASAPQRKRESSRRDEAESEDREDSDDDELMALEQEDAPASGLDALSDAQADLGRRASTRALYRPLGPTREYAERFYLGRRLHEAGPALAPPNPFWRDLADHRGPGPFLSSHFVHCTDGSAALLLALACLDLPTSPAAHRLEPDASGRTVLHAAGPVLVFHERLTPAVPAAPGDPTPAVVVQRYLDGTHAGSPEARAELIAGQPYLGQVIVSNPSPASRQLDLLRLLPDGSLPLGDPRPVRLDRLHLGPYQTTSLELPFYFPHPGSFGHHPPQLAAEGRATGAAPARTLTVAREPSSVDDQAWEHLSQAGSDAAVLAALQDRNLHTIDLTRIAWRLRERAFYDQALTILERRRVQPPALWAYALLHGDAPRAAEFVRLRGLDRHAALALRASWIELDPERDALYEHLDYAPLINPRVHGPAGSGPRVLSPRLAAQLERLLLLLCSRAALDDRDRLALAVSLLLQDRLDDARALLARVDEAGLRERLPLAYVRAYLALADDPAAARAIAAAHADHPVDRWRDRFREVLAQLDEIEGGFAVVIDAADRDQRQGQLAATTPSLELRPETDGLRLHHRHAPRVEVGFYEMDLELLFSQKPFALQAFRERPPLLPNATLTLETGPGEASCPLPIPDSLRGRPLLIEARAGEARATVAHTAGALLVQLAEGHGQLRVAHATTGAALPRVYVKVYARGTDGVERFHRDGYTDLRGRFDYASVSTDAPAPRRFALLLLSDQHGAALREVAAPTG